MLTMFLGATIRGYERIIDDHGTLTGLRVSTDKGSFDVIGAQLHLSAHSQDFHAEAEDVLLEECRRQEWAKFISSSALPVGPKRFIVGTPIC